MGRKKSLPISRAIRKARLFLRKCKRNLPLAVPLIFIAVVVFGVAERTVMTKDYTILLNTIAKGESKGNYNAYFGNSDNATIRFTSMTVGEVLAWQQSYVAQGSPSNAVGRYQFIQPTLAGLIDQLHIDKNALFDEALQDKLAVELLKRRGVEEFVKNRISREQFAHNLSREWAALPNITGPDPQASYYQGDGLNKAQISIEEMFSAIDAFKNT